MLEALLDNKQSPQEIAALGHWSLASKIPQIIEALEGHRMSDHHRFMIRQCLRHMRTIEEMIEETTRVPANEEADERDRATNGCEEH